MFEIADLWKQVSQGGSRPFVIHRGGSTSYREMRSLVGRAFVSLQAMGLAPGERVGVLLQDEAMASAAFAAALLRGLVPVMLPPDIGTPRLESIRRTIEPALIARDEGIFSAAEPDRIEPVAVPREDLAYLLFTSGTTAAPSGVEITRGNLCSHIDTLTRLFDFGTGTRIFNPTPLAHTDGLIFGSMLPMAIGGAVIRPGPMQMHNFEDWIGLAQRSSSTHMVTNPTVLSLIDRTATRDDYFTFDGFRGILSSGSLLRADLWLRLEQRFGTEIWNLYGLSETVTTALYAGRHPEMGPVGTLGIAVDCEARIAHPETWTMESGDENVGELQLRGDHIFRGYWRNPERTNATFSPDGWMRTGDLVRFNKDHSYDFLGRIKAAINSGGTLIRGEEVDECLLRHPAVVEVVTVGLPDEDFEEIAVSAVVLKAPSDEAALTQHCREQLEALKVPKRIIAFDAIPRGDAGKPQLLAVKEMISDALRHSMRELHAPIDATDEAVLRLAALVFGVEEASLTPDSTPQTVDGWDSFRHVSLVLQAEDHFSVRIPGTFLPSIRSLGDLSGLIRKLKAQT